MSVSKRLNFLIGGAVVIGLMILGFSIRTYYSLHRPKRGDPITFEMYQTLLDATSTLCFGLLPIISLFLFFIAICIWSTQRRSGV